MRLAIIDLGTNSIRFDVHEVSKSRGGAPLHRRLYREKTMVRLGQDLFVAGKLSLDGKRRTLQAICSFAKTIQALEVDHVTAFGTAAMRDASDGEDFLEEIKEASGLEFRIITGAEEATLIAHGILKNEPNLPKGLYALIDIGGGSTEVSICRGQNVLHAHSFNLGVAKLQQVFLKSQPPLRTSKLDPVQSLRDFIKSVVLPQMIIEHWPKTPAIIGSSGTALALAKMIRRDKDADKLSFDKKELAKIVKQIEPKTSAQLLSTKGMDPKRVDLILAGAILLDEFAQMLGAKTVRPTEFSLRDGILETELKRIASHQKLASFSLADIEKRIAAWGVDVPHMVRVQRAAEFLFDHLKTIHRLKSEWKIYLSSAALLHDVGEVISHAHHAEHSEYIVKNANFVGMHVWEAELIAKICRFHKEEKLLEKKNEKKIPYAANDELRPIFLKLLSLLQMADSLDRTHQDVLKLKAPVIKKAKVTLKFSSRTACDLEILRFEQKKALFEELFKRKIELVRSR